ncbi:MAG: GNAT family N-acetyltransferase [archaeon]
MTLDVKVGDISKESLPQIMPDLLRLEHNWTGIGELPWGEDKFRDDLPGKWNMSKYVSANGRIVGYFIGALVNDGKTGKLVKIITDYNNRGNGISDVLWNEFLDGCRKHGVEKAEFKVLVNNPRAINFYRKHGCLLNSEKVLGTDNQWRFLISYNFHLNDVVKHANPSIGPDDKESVIQALEGSLSPGVLTDNFVAEMSSYVGRKYGVATNSGTSALYVALRSLDVGEGDEVIIPSYTCYSLLSAVEQCRAKPLLVDINPYDFNISYEDTKAKVNPNTKAIVLPHLFGNPIANLESFLELGTPVVEDCAQSVGAEHNGRKVGSFGDISIFSFKATKMMTTGVGGMVLTDNKGLSDKINALTTYDNRGEHGECYNFKISDLQAALGLSQLKKLDGFVGRRKEIAAKYDQLFRVSNVDFELPPLSDENVFFRYVIKHAESKDFIDVVRARGVEAVRPVFMPLHSYLALPDKSFPNTSDAYAISVMIPLYPSLIDRDVENIVGVMINWKYEK